VALCRGFYFLHMLAKLDGVFCSQATPLPLFKAGNVWIYFDFRNIILKP
jgi:hypothetical protein